MVITVRTAGGAAAWLGIDLGTSGCRVVAADAEGGVLAVATRPLHSDHPRPGWHEQDPRSWRQAIAGACQEVVASIGDLPVHALAVCATSGTVLLVGSDGEAVTPALMYDDARAAGEPRTAEIVEAWDQCSERSGYHVQPTWALPKIGWLIDNVENAGSFRVCHCADYIGWWLTGEPVSLDTSHALKAGLDLVSGEWPADAFEAVAIPFSLLPDVVRPGATLGVVGRRASAATGLAEGTSVVAGMTDGCASQIAAGTVHSGQWNLALGTTFVLKGVSDSLLRGDALYSHRHPDGGWLPGGASNSGAGALAARFAGTDLSAMDQQAAAYLPSPVVRYPLPRPGERFPFVRLDADPFLLGSPRADADLFAAILQSVAFVERLSIDYVALLGADVTGCFTVTGGATASPLWNQLRADVLGRPVMIPRYPDAAFGMAVVAAASSGRVCDAADEMVAAKDIIEPRSGATARYLDIYRRMVDELEKRGYIDTALADRARAA
jgi:D-ribulokinase